MTRKGLTQALLVFIIFSLVISSYFYLTQNQLKEGFVKEKDLKNSKLNDENNLIEGIKYISKDKSGNIYEIKAKSGKNDLNNNNLILLNDVNAKIKLKNDKNLEILSNFAQYNNINYYSKFYQNVTVTFEQNKIICDNAILNFSEGQINLTGNVVVENQDLEIKVDNILININNKTTKMSMFKKSEKVKMTVNNGIN